MAMADTTIRMPEDLMTQVQKAAMDEQRSVSEVLTEAVQRYLSDRKWLKIVSSAEQRARAKGLTEADVPRLVEEARREKRERGA